jgi:hypothetical protein
MKTSSGIKPALAFPLAFIWILASCSLPSQTEPTAPAPAAVIENTIAPQPSPSAESSPTPTPLPPTETLAPTETATAIPTDTPTVTPVPTYAILRGKVTAERLSCRYGPGNMYLYLYGLIQGANQDVIGRTDSGSWVLTKSRGDSKSCWVKSEFISLNGDISSLEVVYPDKYNLPPSNQGYKYPWDVVAIRSGSQVTISWKSEALRPGDEEDANMVIYIVETWTCQSGQLTFTPIGTNLAQITVTDEPGCAQPSHGRVFFQEKHGYAGPSEITWP